MQKSFLKVMEVEHPSLSDRNEVGSISTDFRGDDDEDFVSKQDHGFPVCLGSQRSRVEEIIPRKVTCILCQEEDTLSPRNGRAFVCAAYVQKYDFCLHLLFILNIDCYRSLLFAQQGEPENDTKLRDLAPANLSFGIDASTCSHTMHYECFHSLLETLLTRERQRPRQQMVFNQKMVDPEVGEYLCPLCKRLSNTAMPLLPALQLMDIDGSHSERSLLELAKQGDELSAMPLESSLSTSVPSASTMSLLLGQKTSDHLVSSNNAMDIDVEEDSQRAVDLFREMTEIMRVQDSDARGDIDVIQVFVFLLLAILSLFFDIFSSYNRARGAEETKARDCHDDVHSPPAALAVWKSAAHVARTTAAVLASERKPLFCAMNTRQRDCLLAMARLSAALSFCIQLLPDFIANMLRVLLAPPPPVASTFGVAPVSPRSPECHTASSPGHSFASSSPLSSDSPAKLLSSTFAQLFSSKKEVNVNLLHVDMLSLALSLMMSIGWTWNDGVQSLKPTRQLREMLPDGSIDELHVLRLCLTGLYFQVFASFEDSEMLDDDSGGTVDRASYTRIEMLWSIARPSDSALVDVQRLHAALNEATLSFLRPLALFYHALTLVNPPEALKDPSVDEFEPLCRYMGLPSHLAELLDGLAIDQLFTMWSAAIPPFPHYIVRQPIRATQLVDLPYEFSDVIHLASTFKYILTVPCSFSHMLYYIQVSINSTGRKCCQCPDNVPCLWSNIVFSELLLSEAGIRKLLWLCCALIIGYRYLDWQRKYRSIIRDCAVVLMTTRNRGCFRAAPYVDEFGEADQGFRRGNPLHLNEELYHKLKQLWLQQGIAEEVVNQYEIDHRNMQYDWGHF
ncbi:hypothetical protein DICVIV_00472 [Dictyocaulus viviparus]|uniref:E3 ubiquitin-protein ligase n=1 Tax=Dictyocaulus viviparus TaxID=29172 RepID=A0A0D8YBF6_DICVI|nr:hypothetical protein DICVIV_00472 [Dictyocaulus viviparus]